MVKRDSQHGERIKASLLQAAATLFIRVGYQATTVRDIAAQAQVTTGSLYHFFGNKEGVFEHLVRDVFATTMSMADVATPFESNPILAVSLELALQLELVSADARLAALYDLAHASHAISAQIHLLAQARFQQLLASAASCPADAVDGVAYRLAITAKSLMMGLVQERLTLNKLDLATRVQLLLSALWSQLPHESIDMDKLLMAVMKLLAVHRPQTRSLLPSAPTRAGAAAVVY